MHALMAAAELTLALQRLNRPEASVTVNVGVIQGGTRPNVVPDRARLEVDVRATTAAAFEAARRAVEQAVESVSNSGLDLIGGLARGDPPDGDHSPLAARAGAASRGDDRGGGHPRGHRGRG